MQTARLAILDMVYKAQSSHIGSNFSVVDILEVIFKNLNKEDRIILSAGWKAAAFYYFLKQHGHDIDLDSYCQPGSKLIGLTEPGIPGVLFAGGSMGMGLPAAVGFALSKKMRDEDGKVYCVMSDGELNSGTTWEAALIASHHKLDNLVVFVDKNNFQAMGKTQDILTSGFPHLNWKILGVNGHDKDMLERAIKTAKDIVATPICFICETVKGKGWKRAENNNIYHYKNLTREEYEEAYEELR